ncbi:hypothetical protein ADZ36_07025 [Streptomyces fradiae]|uniref:Uncharacterized protein n=1 Tax=Streptomyces fradiae TaxID=1906 RepID=A0ACC4WF06_STRFR|nr:hypothetical protein ADZ36_07025 [Streptomyces fradiae]OFA48475.1 hypothetical protein BEN35_18810 [Streptomyces fradiae]
MTGVHADGTRWRPSGRRPDGEQTPCGPQAADEPAEPPDDDAAEDDVEPEDEPEPEPEPVDDEPLSLFAFDDEEVLLDDDAPRLSVR